MKNKIQNKNTENFLKKSITISFFVFVIFFNFFTPKAHALTLTPIRIEISGDPGATLKEEVTLINERDTSETFYSSFANFEAQGETGNPAFVDPRDDLGTWIKAPSSITLAPRAQATVPFLITIPTNAEPGGHFAALFWGTIPPNQGAGQVSIGAKTGLLILLSVNGDVKVSGGILDFNTKSGKHFFESLPVDFVYKFRNNAGFIIILTHSINT